MKTSLKLAGLALTGLFLAFTPKQATHTALEVSTTKTPSALITWKSTDINLGEIVQNKPVTIDFEFTNTGEGPVIITSVQASCGCTATNYAKTPVLPGETTKITAVFNAAAKGAFKKQVTVVTNAEENPKTLFFSGTVI